MTLIRVLPMSLTKLDELHESGDGDTHQVPRLCTKSSCQDRTGNPWPKEIDIRLTRNDHFWPAAAPIPRPNPWTPKPKREPSSESFREKTLNELHDQTWNQLDLHDSLYPAEVDFDSMSLTLRDTLNTMDCIVFPCNRLD